MRQNTLDVPAVGTNSGTAAAQRLDLWLDALTQIARTDAAHSPRQQEYLTDALGKIERARVELGRCPEGATLAEAMLGASLGAVWLARYFGRVRPLARSRAKRAKAADRRADKIRRDANGLDPDLTDTAKARILRRRYKNLSQSRISHIIGQQKKSATS